MHAVRSVLASLPRLVVAMVVGCAGAPGRPPDGWKPGAEPSEPVYDDPIGTSSTSTSSVPPAESTTDDPIGSTGSDVDAASDDETSTGGPADTSTSSTPVDEETTAATIATTGAGGDTGGDTIEPPSGCTPRTCGAMSATDECWCDQGCVDLGDCCPNHLEVCGL